MSVSGSWNVHFSWGCSGAYGPFTATFNSDGTWSGSGFNGHWAQVGGMIEFNFQSGPAVYAGNVQGGAMVGQMTTFSGLNGCWYATSASGTAFHAAKQSAEHQKLNADGQQK
ncbi:MAG TPA: hypothetical protein VGR95_10025 [Thermoanaerobaculia bacterium]|nr:hypothetical protein [Thermoanaerobaculia bacterium]